MSKLKVLLILLQIVFLASCSQGVSFFSDADNPKYNSTVTGTISKPEGDGPFPAVVLMHGCSGLDSPVRRGLNAHASNLNSNGFVTFIIDSFSKRRKSEFVCRDPGALGAAVNYRTYDAFHALEFLQSQPYVDKNNIFLMGQSNGGSVAIEAARYGADEYVFSDSPMFQAVVAFYPNCGRISSVMPFEIVSPLLTLTGRNDDWLPPHWCVIAKEYVGGADYEVIVYENAHHSFDLFIPVQSYSGHTVGGNSEARADSRDQMLNWFLSHMQE
jgi:dienelactone hydrolase